MLRKPIDFEAVRQADADLAKLLADHPELREPNPERQHAPQRVGMSADQGPIRQRRRRLNPSPCVSHGTCTPAWRAMPSGIDRALVSLSLMA